MYKFPWKGVDCECDQSSPDNHVHSPLVETDGPVVPDVLDEEVFVVHQAPIHHVEVHLFSGLLDLEVFFHEVCI